MYKVKEILPFSTNSLFMVISNTGNSTGETTGLNSQPDSIGTHVTVYYSDIPLRSLVSVPAARFLNQPHVN